jgi:CheY-like chemotaxis protein
MTIRAQSLAGLSILLVEDDPDTRELMVLALVQAGASVRATSDADDGLELFKAAAPAVVLADIAMPGHDGMWLLRQVRSMSEGAAVPFVAFTARAMKGDRERVLTAGFAAHIVKPAEPDQVIRVLQMVIRRCSESR